MGKRRTGLAFAACAAFVAATRGDDHGVDDAVNRLVPGLYLGDAAAHKASLDGLRKLGPAALPALLRSADPDVGSAAFDAVMSAAAAIDAEQALATIETCRSEWPTLGWAGKAIGGDGCTVAEAMERRLQAARKAKWSKPVPLAPATLDDGFRVPPWADVRFADALPKPFARADVRCREKDGKLEIDAALDGAFATKVEPGRAAVVAVGAGESARRVLVHRKLDAWYAACPSLLRGEIGKTVVELMDADADGTFDGPADLARFGDAPFRPLAEGPLTWIGGALTRFRLSRDAGSLSISVAPEPEPAWLDPMSAAGIAALHEWRCAFGFAPQRADRERWRCCGLHHDYWKKAGLAHDLRDHDEDPAKPGYTVDGEKAGHSASCGWNRNGAEFVRVIGASVLHRESLIGRAADGVGFFVGPMGQLLWGGAIDGAVRGFPGLVPAPGQTGVPTLCETELPSPTSDPKFYDRAHGFPVLVTWSGLADQPVSGRRLEVFEPGAAAPLAGVTFSKENKYAREFSDDSVTFVAAAPLPKSTLLTARLRAVGAAGPIEIVWQFRTR